MRKPILKVTVGLFLVLCILFVPFTFNLFPYQQGITEFIFCNLLGNKPISSDSKGMYGLVLILFVVATLVAIIFIITKVKLAILQKVKCVCYTICIYYLAAIFIKYGFDKVFKSQFYQPEPNTLYTKLGNLDKDILYWSTIGSSYLYNVVTGSIEIISSILLLLKRTRGLGIILLLIVLSQIVLINFAFDISVKLFSLLLLTMAIYLATSYFKNLDAFLFKQKVINVKEERLLATQSILLTLKCFAIGILFLEALYPYLFTKNFNDDKTTRPYLHGAYQVIGISVAKGTLQPNLYPFKRFFIHRNGYIVFEYANETMQDYALQYDTLNKKIILTNYKLQHTNINYEFNISDSTLILQMQLGGNLQTILSKAINYKKMNALNDSFSWTAD